MVIHQQFLRFCVVGFLSTLVNYVVFLIGYKLLGVNYLLSSGLGFIVGVLIGYRLNKYWTFSATKMEKGYFIKYSLIYSISLVLGLLFLDFQVRILSFSPLIANIFTIVLTTCTNFIGSKWWVFKK